MVSASPRGQKVREHEERAMKASVVSGRSTRLGALLLSAFGAGCSAGGDGGAVSVAPGEARPSNNGDAQNADFGSGIPSGGVDFGSELAPGPGVDVNFTGIPECEQCQDFPTAPIFEDGLGPDAAAAFNTPASGAPPCIIEPRDGMLIPANMLRPRVRFTTPNASADAVHQITLHADREQNDLIVYTRQNPWLVPPEVWDGLRTNVFEEDITVTVRTSQSRQAPSESRVTFRIAPVQAGGSMVYWGATTEMPGLTTTRLFAFGVGEEAVITALRPGDVTETMIDDNARIKREQYGAPAGQARCVGCHTSTGDGQSVITADHWPWNLAVTNITTKARPTDVTAFGAFLLQMPWLGVSSTSRGDWATGSRRLVTSAGQRPAMEQGFVTNAQQSWRDVGFGGGLTQNRDGLIWIDMAAQGVAPEVPPREQVQQQQLPGQPQQDGQAGERAIGNAMLGALGTGWGVIARTGDPRAAVTPDWSHDGSRIAYTSTDSTQDGRIGGNANEVDIYTVPYNGGQGGQATPLTGASTAGVAEYYPDFSADDRFIAFNRVQEGRGQIYYHPRGEIYVVPAAGGEPTRLAANDPPQCSGEASPGVTNSWPKWSPTVRGGPENTEHAGKRYYFLLFSSARQSPFRLGQGPASQLYLTTLVQLPSGELVSYPAMYLWNQAFEITNPDAATPEVAAVQTSNLTPAFDEFVIPPRPPVIVR
jgi:WD40-like Beta Propeller Repeat